MTTLREAAQQALEALEEYQSNGSPFLACDGAVAALRAALAQQNESEMHAAVYFAACKEFRKIRDQRDALLEALKEIDSWLVCSCIATAEDMAQSFPHMQQVASAAIAAVEETK